MSMLRERGETLLIRTDFANQFCFCAEVQFAFMGFFDSDSLTITESWVGKNTALPDSCSLDITKSAERQLALWAKINSADTAAHQYDHSNPLLLAQQDGSVIGVGSPIGDTYPVLMMPDKVGSGYEKHKTLLQMGMAYVMHQLSEDFYARCSWMENLVDAAMQTLSIQFLVVEKDGSITFDSLKDLPHQIENADQVALEQRSFLKSVMNSPELRDAITAAISPAKSTSIVSVFDRSGVAHLLVVTPLTAPDTSSALILFENENTDHFKLRQHFFDAYHLTRSESLVAHEILSGLSTVEAAKANDLSPYTVRSYMKQIFAKTGTHKQTELVSLYFNSILPVTSHLMPAQKEARRIN